MQSNNTSGSQGAPLSAENIITLIGMGISLCASLITFFTTILTCTYIAMKSKFKDKQNTDIVISTETAERKDQIKISLINDETYLLKNKTFNSNKKNKSIKDDNSILDENDLDIVLGNNNRGDQIIADTRSEMVNSALLTYLKAAKIHSLGQGGDRNVLDIPMHFSLKKKEDEQDVIDDIVGAKN